jgi:hypothetical protein
VSEQDQYLYVVFALGALAGLLSRWGPLSGWLALILPILVPPASIGLCMAFC